MTGSFGSGGLGSADEPSGLDATLLGTSALAADADITNDSVNFSADSAISLTPTVALAAEVSMVGDAVYTAVPNDAQTQATLDLEGESFIGANAELRTLGLYGVDPYGSSPYGGLFPPYGIESAISLSNTLVRVRYTAMFNPAFLPLITAANYTISPPLTVFSAIIESAQSVLLTVSPMDAVLYTVTISDALGYFNQPLSPFLTEATFLGLTVSPTFFAVGTRDDRVRLVFTQAMLNNSALTDSTYYLVEDLDGNTVVVSSVTAEQTSSIRSVILHMSSALVTTKFYKVTVQTGVETETFLELSPNHDIFQWVDSVLTTTVPIGEFTGELTGGLLGDHNGLVFFSPALELPAADSIIDVDDVDVCTKAFDEYHFPQPIDPAPIMTYSPGLVNGVVTTGIVTGLNTSGFVLWGAFPRLSDAKIDFGYTNEDSVDPFMDSLQSVTLLETWPAGLVGILNNSDWALWTRISDPSHPDYVSDQSYQAASITAALSGVATVTGLLGMTPNLVGRMLTVQGAANPHNNGNFLITAFISATSVQIANGTGVAPDANNGALAWMVAPVAFMTANTLSPGWALSRIQGESNMVGIADP